jgi:hypothetical protein
MYISKKENLKGKMKEYSQLKLKYNISEEEKEEEQKKARSSK